MNMLEELLPDVTKGIEYALLGTEPEPVATTVYDSAFKFAKTASLPETITFFQFGISIFLLWLVTQ